MRTRTVSNVSSVSSRSTTLYQYMEDADNGYDYLAKIIILGPSGTGKSCLLHRFVKGEWKVLTSQTIGVEFSSKIVDIGGKSSIKMQLWDTAGQERFRSLTRSYYRGSAGAVLVYDVTRRDTFESLKEYLLDIKSLTNDTISVVIIANKSDLRDKTDPTLIVPRDEALAFCNEELPALFGITGAIPFLEVSALTGENVEETFHKLGSMILTKLELGVIDPEDMGCGVQYGDIPRWDTSTRSPQKGKRSNILTPIRASTQSSQTQMTSNPQAGPDLNNTSTGPRSILSLIGGSGFNTSREGTEREPLIRERPSISRLGQNPTGNTEDIDLHILNDHNVRHYPSTIDVQQIWSTANNSKCC